MNTLRSRRLAIAFSLSLASLAPSALHAQAGDAKDRPGTVQQEIWREMDVPPAPVLSPEQALESFHVAPGYRLELVAAEPLVNDPVAIAWDEQGRLWAAEMWAYMPDPDGVGEDQPVSRVVVMEDRDEDGRMDRSTVFLDQLVMPRAVAIVDGGVLIADPPNLLFCEDLNGDLRSDRETVVAEYAAVGNVEHAENGLVRALDNWIYNAKSNRRLTFEDGKATFQQTNFRGQWGITMDDWGRLYYNHNSRYLYGDLVPWEYASRHPGWEPEAGIGYDVVPDRSVYTARINPGINRAYREDYLRPDNRMRAIDAASDPEIYRGDRYPESARGNAFVPDPAGHVVSRFILKEHGLNVVGEKQLQPHDQWGQIEFIASTDERFRPVNISNGPDGFLYIVDMYRGIIQHKTYLTTFLRKQIIERGLDEPVGRGRIYRLVHESDSPSRSVPQMGDMSLLELVDELENENGWERDTAQRLLVESETDNPQVLQALAHTARNGTELGRIHALWTLQGLDAVDPDTVIAAIRSGSVWVATHALRVAGPMLDQARQDNSPLFQAYLEALVSDRPRLQLQALHLLPETNSRVFILDTLTALTESELADPYFLDAAVSALYGHEVAYLERLDSAEAIEAARPLVSALAFAAYKERDASKAGQLLAAATEAGRPNAALLALTEGFARASSGQKPRPLALEQAPDLADASLPAERKEALAAAFTWPGKQGETETAFAYSDAERASIERGKTIYENTCAICHQSDGRGQSALAPALAGADWVTGPKDRLALIVYHGIMGEIEVNGESWNSVMPAHGNNPNLEGERLTDVLNYIRSAWDNDSSPYQPGEARALVEPHSEREDLWTVEELEQALQSD